MKKTIILIVVLSFLVIGGLLTSAVSVDLKETRSVEATRLAIQDSVGEYKETHGSLVNYCNSSLYESAVDEFIGESNCAEGTAADGKDFSITLSTINATWNCKLQNALGFDAEIVACSEIETGTAQPTSNQDTVTSVAVTSHALFPESRDVDLKTGRYERFSLSMQAPAEWDEQAYGFKYSNTNEATDNPNYLTEMIEIDFETNVDSLSPADFAERKIDLLKNMRFAYSDYRLVNLEPVSVAAREAVYTRAVEYSPDGKADFIEDRYFIPYEDKMLIAKYRREAEITPVDFVALVNTLQFTE